MIQVKDKIQKIIEKSGHNFHLQVSDLLREAGWGVVDSPYYNDPDRDKAREIDIIATKEYIVSDDAFFNKNKEKMIIKLFIDCKYVKSPLVFWFKNKNKEKAIELAKDNPILEDKEDCYLNGREKHHYSEGGEVAWQWSQENQDIIADAQHKALKALIFYSEHQETEYYEIRYPMIVVNDFTNFARLEKEQGSYSEIKDNFQIEVNYSYKNKEKEDITKYFLIDVVSYKLLNNFLKNFEENDIALLKNCLAWDLRLRNRQNSESQWDDDSNLYNAI
jgi:hypothetical protein